jgi:hypothetical protein
MWFPLETERHLKLQSYQIDMLCKRNPQRGKNKVDLRISPFFQLTFFGIPRHINKQSGSFYISLLHTITYLKNNVCAHGGVVKQSLENFHEIFGPRGG